MKLILLRILSHATSCIVPMKFLDLLACALSPVKSCNAFSNPEKDNAQHNNLSFHAIFPTEERRSSLPNLNIGKRYEFQ